MVEADVPSKAPDPGHELSDLNPKSIALFGFALAATIIFVLIVTYALFQRFVTVEKRSQEAPSPLSYTHEPTPEPHLLVDPGQDLHAMRAAEDAVLKSYDWIDREKGIVRIPIARAIEIIAEKGLPARPQKETTDEDQLKRISRVK